MHTNCMASFKLLSKNEKVLAPSFPHFAATYILHYIYSISIYFSSTFTTKFANTVPVLYFMQLQYVIT